MSNNQLEHPSVYLERLNQYLRATSPPSMDDKSKNLSLNADEDRLKMSSIKYMRKKVLDEANKNKWIVAQEEHSSAKVEASSTIKNWVPQDDGIDVTLPLSSSEAKAPTREDVNSYIEAGVFGNGSARKKRLQVFTEICPDREDDGSAGKSS